MIRTILSLILISMLSAPAITFQQRQIENVPDLPLRVLSTTKVEGFVAPLISFPIICGPNGDIFVHLASTEGEQELVRILPDGSKVIRFGREKLIDVQKGTMRSMFATDSRVYVLVVGYSDPQSVIQRIPKKDGSYDEQRVQIPRKRTFYVSEFNRDGEYQKSVTLDVPFLPRQFGVFPSGNFLVAGRTEDGLASQEPRVAIFTSSGQLLRLLNLEKDISRDSPRFKQDAPDPVIAGTKTLQAAVDLSSIIQDGSELLLVRKGAAAPIFAISAGGEVRRIVLDVPSKLSLYSLHPAGGEWIGQFLSREPNVAGVRLTSYAIDRETGKAIANYNYATELGFGLACTDGTEFTFLKRESDTLSIVRAAPTRRSIPPRRDFETLPLAPQK